MILFNVVIFLLTTNTVFCTPAINSNSELFESEPCAKTCTCHEGTFNAQKSNGSTRLYKPVVMIHGIMDNSALMNNLTIRIKKLHPQTQIFNLNCYSSLETLTLLWRQIEIYGKEVMAIDKAFPEGIHLLGYSQGGVIARGILQLFPKHNVRNFISLAAPQRGVRAMTNRRDESWLESLFIGGLGIASHSLNVNDLLHDPHSQKKYLTTNEFLPVFNNELEALQQSKYKRGIIRLQHMILIGGPDDGYLVPWQSCHFEFYELGYYGSTIPIIPLRKSDIYVNDRIGLKTLDKARRLRIHTVPNVDHMLWCSNETVIDQYILPYLN